MKTNLLLSLVTGVACLAALGSAAPAPPLFLQLPVQLNRAGSFTILSKAGISTIGTTAVRGNMGVSPIDSSAITGFALQLDSSNLFSTSALVTGKVYAADYAARTANYLTRAMLDVENAYTDAAGRTMPDYTELGAGNIGGMTLAPGLYKWSTGLAIPAVGVTLQGSSSDVWIFQVAQNLDLASSATVTLSGGAVSRNVFWQVAGQTTLGTSSALTGVVLCRTAIVMNTGSTLRGRALAQTAVTLDAAEVRPN